MKKNPFIHPLIPLTLTQAQEIVDLRSSGTYQFAEGFKLFTLDGDWDLASLEALMVVFRCHHDLPYKLPQEPVSVQAVLTPLEGEQLLDIVDDLEKGPHALVHDAWTLEEVEALVSKMQSMTPNLPVQGIHHGALGRLSRRLPSEHGWEWLEVMRLLHAGINPQAHPRVWELFIRHRAKGWSLPRIVCAANWHHYRTADGTEHQVVVAGARHCDRIMGQITQRLEVNQSKDPNFDPYIDSVQGFIDQHGNFYNRYEAWTIAQYHGQITRQVGWSVGRLYSEHLY